MTWRELFKTPLPTDGQMKVCQMTPYRALTASRSPPKFWVFCRARSLGLWTNMLTYSEPTGLKKTESSLNHLEQNGQQGTGHPEKPFAAAGGPSHLPGCVTGLAV